MSIPSAHQPDWSQIAEALAFIDGTFPFAAVYEARDHWPDVREHFLAALVSAVARPEKFIDEDNALPMYAQPRGQVLQNSIASSRGCV